ncbi:MAG: right-handed parallel beta-helix repeat-containing protein [Candidatus Cloacimonetes bacterium]|nr:right-handed parallel beta-helix repeat-containing protein [Candidatus Cloacimonadota bacterium]
MPDRPFSRVSVRPRFVAGLLLCLGLPLGASALELSGTLTADRRVGPADSPVTVSSELIVPEGITLSIAAGTRFEIAPGTSITVNGTVLARGEKRAMIEFDCATPGELWGNLSIHGQKDLPSYDADWLFLEDSGSLLDWCRFSHAGRVADVAYNGGAVYLNGAAPCITNCVFENNESDRCGGVLAYNFSLPLIADCTFENNRATVDDGGAIYCFFYSDAVVRQNFIVSNRAGRHGGGIYVSNSSPLIEANALIDNESGMYGGAMFLSGSDSRVLENAIFENRSAEKATGIVFQAECKPEVRGNSLLSGSVEVLGMNLARGLDLSGNWWGTTDEIVLSSKVRQDNGRGRDVEVTLLPCLDRPTENLITQPVEILGLQVMASSAWSDSLRFDLVDGATVRVQVNAVDRNKYAPDQTPVTISVVERPQQTFKLILQETGKNSGIFRAQFQISDSLSNVNKGRLNVHVGEHVAFASTMDETRRALYYVDEPRPVVHDLAITSDPDPEHIVSQRLTVAWQFFDLLERRQQAWEIQVAQDRNFSGPLLWDSGANEAAADLRSTAYAGSPLIDGERYFFRVRLRAGGNWSEWETFLVRSEGPQYSFRLNSLPSVPLPVSPENDSILAVFRPQFKVPPATDREGDALSWEFQLAEDETFGRIVASTREGELASPEWTCPVDLKDNARYFWRVRIHDGFESTDWSPVRSFWLNPVEQDPAPFALLGPEGDVADVLPEFRWQLSTDPDPKASIAYRFVRADNAALSSARRNEAPSSGSYRDTAELPNRAPVWWAIEAVDNSGRVTRSQQIFRLQADTTPSSPGLQFPRDEEIMGNQALRLAESVDPWPQDLLLYTVEISGDGQFNPPLIRLDKRPFAELRDTSLDAWPESAKLQDNQSYHWRARATDNHGAQSAFSETALFWFNRRNDPPTLPGKPFQPSGGVELAEQPVLSWGASTDPDHSDPVSGITYSVQVCTDPTFVGSLVEHSVVGVNRLSLAPGELSDNTRWYWRVRASDDQQESAGWSEVQNFVTNARPDPPAPFAITSPRAGEASWRLDGVDLAWSASSDPDFGSSLSYRWVLARDEGLKQVVAEGTGTETSVAIRKPIENGTPYWLGVSAIDNTGLKTAAAPVAWSSDSRPSAPVLQSTGADLELVPGDKLSWSASQDPDPQDRVEYRVTITEVGGSRALVNASGLMSISPQLDRLPGGNTLKDDTQYNWTVTARDSHGLEATSETGSFWMNTGNDAPTAPTFSGSPVEGSTQSTTAVQFSWTAASDPDHSDPPATLSYQLQLAVDKSFASPRNQAVPAGVLSASSELSDNSRWFARVRAVDRAGSSSPWSAVISFVVNTREDPPTAPRIQQPARSARLVKLDRLNVEFEASTDPDLGSSVSYRLELLDQAGKVLTSTPTTATSKNWQTALTNRGEYQLRVIAVDNTGLETASTTQGFSVDTTPGSVQISGREGEILGRDGRLLWAEAVDPDPDDVLSYEIELDRSRAFGTPVKISSREAKVSLSSFNAQALAENQEHLVRVRAVDSNGITGDWSPAFSFIYNARNEAPTACELRSPADGVTLPASQSFSWSAASDPDPEDRVSYRLELRMTEAIGDAALASPQNFNTTDTFQSVTLDQQGTWSWTVVSIDAAGLETRSASRRLVISTP